jgi:hypothetical protein
MKIFDNVNQVVGNDLRAELQVDSKLKIAAATFSIYAFEALKSELKQIKELQFIFTSPTFVASDEAGRQLQERRQFYVPPKVGETSLYGTDFEIRLRNKLTQKAIARECAAWIREKVRFRSNRTGSGMQQFAVVNELVAYFPLQGFTTSDLGFEAGNSLSNIVTRLDTPETTRELLGVFDQTPRERKTLQMPCAETLSRCMRRIHLNASTTSFSTICFRTF